MVREDREEEEGGRYRIENPGGAELVGRVDGLQQSCPGKNELVVIAQQGAEGAPEKEANPCPVLLHEFLERIAAHGEPAAEKENEEIVEHPVVQAVEEEGFEQGVLGEIGDIVIEGRIETGKIIEGNLQEKENGHAFLPHAADHEDPERHEKIKPQKDHEKVEVVLGEAEKEHPDKLRGIRDRGLVDPMVHDDIEYGPKGIGQKDRTEAARHEIPVAKGLAGVKIVEEAEGRNEKKDGDAESREYFEKRNQMEVGRGILDILGPYVDADDSHHGDAANVFDCCQARFFQAKDSSVNIFLQTLRD